MSDPVAKGLKRSPSRSNLRSNSSSTPSSASKSASKARNLPTNKSAKSKLNAKRTAAEKAPVRKAAKSKTAVAASKPAPVPARPAKSHKATPAKAAPKKAAAPKASNAPPTKKPVKPRTSVGTRSAPASASAPVKQATRPSTVSHRPAVQPLSRQPTRDEAAALRAFEKAHREFSRGNFSEARVLFVGLIEEYAGVSEVTARARTYVAIAESRLRSDSGLPRDADSLYDRGVIELNRGEYVAAQEMFERALKREPEAAHIHYGLAATRARLGSVESAMSSLEHAINLQPTLRARAQHDIDLTTLRNEPDFERIIFSQK